MSTTTKSIRAILRLSYKVAKEELSDYSHTASPKKYTQPQLFSMLVAKAYMRMDYRRTSMFFDDFSDARGDIELNEAPHFTTLQKACHRLLKDRQDVTNLLERTLEEFSFKNPH